MKLTVAFGAPSLSARRYAANSAWRIVMKIFSAALFLILLAASPSFSQCKGNNEPVGDAPDRKAQLLTLCRLDYSARFAYKVPIEMEVTKVLGFTQLRCSFCRKKDSQVKRLVAGPRGYTGARVYICDACVAVTVGLINNPPSDNHPGGNETSMWRKLSHRLRLFARGGHNQRVDLSVSA